MNTSDRRTLDRETFGGLSVALATLALLTAVACTAPMHPSRDRMSGADGMSLGSAATNQIGSVDRTIAISTTDQLRFEPSTISVSAGQTVEFVITNTGHLPHEVVIGDQAAQDEHEGMMAGGGSGHMQHRLESDAVEVPANGSATLVHTFDQPGTLLFGCHVAGHYPAGMQGTITVARAEA